MKKILAVASVGGHWIQLLRVTQSLTENDVEITYCSTKAKCASMVEGHNFYTIHDFSRWDFYKIVPVFFQSWKIIVHEKPDMVITTGAAPGLICLFAAWLLRRKTVWLDSAANVQHLSISGQIASKFVSRIYTQWKAIANSKIIYAGNVFGEDVKI